jgi:glycosyltransferase involved in cell wall biosynthesis
MLKNLLILTSHFPIDPLTSESWLADEMEYSHSFFDAICIFPDKKSEKYIPLPSNCKVLNLEKSDSLTLTINEKWNCLKIVLSDFKFYPNKFDFIRSLRYNLSLIRHLHLKAKKIHYSYNGDKENTILYAYWADNLVTIASIMSQVYGPYKIVSRAHGFEIFEDQTKYEVIPFRRFHYKFLTKLYADSKKGFAHLQSKANVPENVNTYSYVGTNDSGISTLNFSLPFSIATCSNLSNNKRLHRMPEILKHISFDLVWHVLGAGEELELIKELNAILPQNIKVIYHGYMNNQDILRFYKANSVNLFVSLSYSEGLPVSMMEAQSFGIPIMSTDVGGCKEICNEETGFLIQRDFDGKEVALKLDRFKNSDKNTVDFRAKCRHYWEKNFSAKVNYTKFAEEIVSFY